MAESLHSKIDTLLAAGEIAHESFGDGDDSNNARIKWHIGQMWQAIGMIAREHDAHVARCEDGMHPDAGN